MGKPDLKMDYTGICEDDPLKAWEQELSINVEARALKPVVSKNDSPGKSQLELQKERMQKRQEHRIGLNIITNKDKKFIRSLYIAYMAKKQCSLKSEFHSFVLIWSNRYQTPLGIQPVFKNK